MQSQDTVIEIERATFTYTVPNSDRAIFDVGGRYDGFSVHIEDTWKTKAIQEWSRYLREK